MKFRAPSMPMHAPRMLLPFPTTNPSRPCLFPHPESRADDAHPTDTGAGPGARGAFTRSWARVVCDPDPDKSRDLMCLRASWCLYPQHL